MGNVDSKNDSCFLENLMKVEKFSSFKKLFRATCYVLRFVKNLLAKLRSNKEKIIKGVISFDEISEENFKTSKV